MNVTKCKNDDIVYRHYTISLTQNFTKCKTSKTVFLTYNKGILTRRNFL